MSTLAPAPAPVQRPPSAAGKQRRAPSRWLGRVIGTLVLCAALVLAGWLGLRGYRQLSSVKGVVIPTAVVQRGDISLTATAKGELRGGSPETLTAPLTGGTDLHLTFLRKTGEQVKKGDVVAEFDTTEQEFKLKEAQADLAEAQQHLVQAAAQRDADQEEDRYALGKARADVSLAELDVRKNPLLPPISAKQNDLALEAARDHLRQLEQNLANRQATNAAALAIQEAGRGKAESQAKTAQENIDAMTLKATRDGYVAIRPNTSGNFFWGQALSIYQIGDSVRPGMAVAEIPDMKNWEITANIGETDRGHISPGQLVSIRVIAVADRDFTGHVKDLGGTAGPSWDRHFECKMSLDDPTPELRPGMSVELVVTTDQLHGVLWLPAQALFESDGRTFVYVRNGDSFAPKDVKLLRRSETRVVLEGVTEGQVVALSDPTAASKTKTGASGPMQALPK